MYTIRFLLFALLVHAVQARSRMYDEGFESCADQIVDVFKRQARPKCSPPRPLHVRDDGNLTRRVMTLPDGSDRESMNVWMQHEVDQGEAIVWTNRAGSAQNTAAYDLFQGAAISAGMRALCGCTGVVILSRQGWYATHYWESISFAPEPEWKFKDADDALQRSVLDPLRKGSGGMYPAQWSLTRAAGTFSDDSVRAFIIRPSETWDEKKEGYREAWDAIKATIKSIVPRLQDDSRWKEITYERLDAEDPKLRQTAAGHVVLKYDPDHPEDSGRQKVTLWVEWNQVYNDEW